VLALAAFTVDSRNEGTYRRPLSSGDLVECIPEGILQGHAGAAPAEPDASFGDRGFTAVSYGWRHLQT
jgi:hypothetical protein